jgi:hypothetical protein
VAARVVLGSSREVGGFVSHLFQLGGKPALSVPKGTGRKGIYKIPLVLALGFVEAARILGGQPFANTVHI